MSENDNISNLDIDLAIVKNLQKIAKEEGRATIDTPEIDKLIQIKKDEARAKIDKKNTEGLSKSTK